VSAAADQPERPADHPEWDRVQRAALVAAGGGLLLCAVGALFSQQQFFRSWLVALLFWLGIALGCMAIVMLQHLTGGAWGLVLRRLLESASRTVPLLAVLFVPLAFGLAQVYPWADAGWRAEYQAEHGGHGFTKADYLSPALFLARAAVYFALWIGLAFVLSRWSGEQDRTADPRLPRRFRLFSAPGLMVYGLTVTFASIDWVMSLEPEWYSTIYGVMFGTGQVLGAMAFAIAVLILLADRPPLRDVVSPGHLRDLGNLMLAFVMLWAYMSFSQFLLIWSANLVEEVPWYLRRGQGGWQYVAVALVLFHFALPFLMLMSRDVKHSRGTLAAVAGLVLVMRFVDLFWLVVPSFYEGELRVHWLDLAALVGVGGAWLAFFIWQLKRMPLLPVGDPYLAEVTRHD
jgi:hypothetical protein